MNEQIVFPGVDLAPRKNDEFQKRKHKWENGFQKWSDKHGIEADEHIESYGCCGYGSMCDYCEDNSYGRPCVRALNEMLRETGEIIDYENMSFEDVWKGARA